MILYRPVGLQELEFIYDSEMKAFPARLPQQPVFYPVLDLEYARQVASDWNVKSGQHAGYVTQFKVEDSYIKKFKKHKVGGSQHQEFWIPSEDMEEFNRHIVGHIKVLEGYFGRSYKGFVPEKFGLQGKNAVEQFTLLTNSYLYKPMEFYLEIKRNHKAVFLNYPFWLTHNFKNPGLKEKLIKAIKEAWFTAFPNIPLPLSPPIQEETSPAKQIASRAKRVVDVEEKTTLDATDSNEPYVVNPDEEDSTPEEDTDSYTQQWVDPEDDTALKQNEPHSSLHPVRHENRSIKRSDSSSFENSDDEDVTAKAQTDSYSRADSDEEDEAPTDQIETPFFVNPVRQVITPGQQNDANQPRRVNPDEKDSLSEEQTDSDSLEDPNDKEPAPPKRIEPRSLANPVRRENTPEKHIDSPSLAKPTPRNPSPVNQTVSHFRQGLELGLSGKYHEAIKELSKAVEENPGQVVARTSLGVAFHRVGDDDHALSCYEAALERDPKNAETHYFRANILYNRKNVREAIAGYTTALGLKPTLIKAHEQSVPQDRLTDYNSTPAEIYRIAKPARRILELNQALEIPQGRQAQLFKERASEYARLSNFEQAIADYTSALAVQPNDADALHSRGILYDQLGQAQHAQEDYQRANALNPQLADVYIDRGVSFGQVGNLRQSIASLTEGIRLAPQNPNAYFNRGTSYFQLGDLENAIADFSNVVRFSPNDEAAYYWRGISNEEAGHPHEAIDDYRQFLALSQDEAARAEIEERLSQLEKGDQNGPGAIRDLLGKLYRFASNQPIAANEKHETNHVQSLSEKAAGEADLYGLLLALGERAVSSIWFGSNVDCDGEKAAELYEAAEQERPMDGPDFLSIASGIRQLIQGDFFAFDPGGTSYWIFLRAWEGSGFYLETDDTHIEKQLKVHYQQAIEEVEGASPPYAGLFLRI